MTHLEKYERAAERARVSAEMAARYSDRSRWWAWLAVTVALLSIGFSVLSLVVG